MTILQYLNALIKWDSHKFSLKKNLISLFALCILIYFEYTLIKQYQIEFSVLAKPFLKGAVLLSSAYLSYAYNMSLKHTLFYKNILYIPVHKRNFLLALSIYMIYEISIRKLIFIIILPIFSLVNGSIGFLNSVLVMIQYLLLSYSGLLLGIIICEYCKKKYWRYLLTVLCISLIYISSPLISILFLLPVIICSVYVFNLLSFKPAKENANTEGATEQYSMLSREFNRFIRDKSSVINYIGILLFGMFLIYNINQYPLGDTEIKYLFILILVFSVSPIYLLFSLDKNNREVFLYYPVNRKKVFAAKLLFSLIMSYVLLFFYLLFNQLLKGEPLIIWIRLFLLSALAVFLRLKFDEYKPNLEWNHTQQIWKSPKKYISFLFIIPIFVFIFIKNTFVYFSLLGILILLAWTAEKFLWIEKGFYSFNNG